MLIGIDGNEANVERRVGIGEYAFQMLRHLKKSQKPVLSEARYRTVPGEAEGSKVKSPTFAKATAGKQKSTKEVNFVVYLKEKPLIDLPKETFWWRYKVFGPKKLWTQVALPVRLFLEEKKPDVFFTPSHYAPRFSPCPIVISIMDLSFVFFPEMFTKKDLFQLKKWTAYSVKKASKILTISNFSKKAIIDHYKVPADKVIVTYPGYDKNKFKVQSSKFKVNNVKDKYNIDGDYILFVGTLQPRKNIERLIEAFNKLRTKNLELRTLKLAIVGKKGWLFKDIFNKVKELNLEDSIIFTDYVLEDELPILYRGAKCLLNPSLYEGFGLPVVEAMACGCPVVVSNMSSLPEIVREAGILVDPYKVDEITKGILKVLNFGTAEYQGLVEKGLRQAKKFSWEECAEKTLKALVSVVD